MFRLENNVPEVYVDKSRDFQLFCRAYDAIFSGVKYSIDSIQRSVSTKECDGSLLELLKTKLGFFSTTASFEDTELRAILQAFPTIIRYKGSKKAIDYVLTLYSRIEHSDASFVRYDELALTEQHKLLLSFSKELRSDKLLLELFSLILPAGYIVEYYVAEQSDTKSAFVTNDTLTYFTDEDTPLDIVTSTSVLPEKVNDVDALHTAVNIARVAENEVRK